MSAAGSARAVAVVVEPEPEPSAEAAPLSRAARAALRATLKSMIAQLDRDDALGVGRPRLIPRLEDDDPDMRLVVFSHGNQRKQAAERLVKRRFVEDGVKVDLDSVFKAARGERKRLRASERLAAPSAPAAKPSRR